MKKLLTILAASAMFFAFGDDINNGINFENYSKIGEDSFPGNATAEDPVTGGQYWYSANYTGNVISNHVNGTPDLPQGVTVPDMFVHDTSNTNFLYLETESPLFRTVKTNGHVPAEFEGVPITNNTIYLDTLVKFTAADSAFTSFEDAADKIAIEYVEHEEESHEENNEVVIDSYGFTNFVIRAGFIASSTALVATNYVVALPDGWLENNKKDAWHRLTVRTLTNIDGHDRVGFKIYLDETPMVYITDDAPKYADFAKGAGIDDDTHTIFPSAVETDKNNYNEISAVAFSGNGSIDDVVFTTTMPDFIKSSEEVVAKFIADSGVAGISVQVGAVTNVVVDMTASSLTATLPAGTTAFTVTVTLDPNGYTFDDMVYGGVSYFNGDEITYNGGDIVITTTRNNFNLFDASGDPISGTFQTLGAALAVTGVAKIQLAHDYDVVEGDIPNGYIDIDQSITLDLNGKILDGGVSAESPLFMVNDGNFVIIDSVGGGKVVYDGPGIVYGASSYIGAVSGDLGPTFDGKLFFEGGDGYVIRANVLAEGNTNEGAFLWTLGDGGDIDSEANLVGDYWVVTPQGVIGTYTVTVTPTANATYAAAYKVGGETITPANNVLTVTVGQTIVITATPAGGYEYASVPTGGWTAGQDGEITIEVSAAGTVVIPAPTAKQSSDDWPTGQDLIDAEGHAAGDLFPGITNALATADAKAVATWAEEQNVAYAAKGSILPEAFLLNCANTQDAIDAAAANFKITAITVDGDTVTVTPADGANYGNGKVVIEGTATLSPISWHEKTTGDHFFRATLVVKPVAVP